MAWSFLDIAFKTLINRVVTSSAKKYYEEFGDNTINVAANEIWALPPHFNDPNTAISAGVVIQRGSVGNLFTLTEDITVPNSQCWYAGPNFANRIKNWVSPKFGDNYRLRLFDSIGTEIFPTDPIDWYFHYQTGILILNGSLGSFIPPLKVIGYTYNGPIGISGSGSSTGLYSETNFVEQTEVIINHEWNTKPQVTVIDATGNYISAAYQYIDNNNVKITFLNSSSGTVILQSKTGGPAPTLGLNNLIDVAINNPQEGNALIFDEASSKWINADPSLISSETKYVTNITCSANINTPVNHNLNDADVIVQCYENDSYVQPEISIVNLNLINIKFNSTKTVKVIVKK